MKYYTVEEFEKTPAKIIDELSSNGDVIITNEEKPRALLIYIAEDNFEETLKMLKQARALLAFNSMRKKAKENGYMSDDEIEKEIMTSRLGL